MNEPYRSPEGFPSARGGRSMIVRGMMRTWLTCLVVVGVAGASSPAETVDTEAPIPESLKPELAPTVKGKIEQVDEFVKQGDYTEAARAVSSAIRQAIKEYRAKTGTQATYNDAMNRTLKLGDQALEAEEYGVAQHCYVQVRSVRKDLPPPVLGLAEVARLSHQYMEAYQLYHDYLKMPRRSQDHRGDLGIGLACLEMGQHDSARFYLQRAVNQAPNNAEAKMGLARALFRKNKVQIALKHARVAVDLDDAVPPEKRHPEYRFWLARILGQNNQLDQGIATARQVVASVGSSHKENPTDTELMDKLDQALILLYQLVGKQSTTAEGSQDPRVFMDMARIVEAQGELRQKRVFLIALNVLAKAQELQPEDVNVLRQVGRLHRLLGDRGRIVSTYQEILKISPGDEVAKSVLRELDAPLAPAQPTTTRSTTAPVTARR